MKFMPTELSPDYFPEIMQKLTEILEGIKKLKEKLAEKDKKILELEDKLKRFRQNGS